MAFIFFVSFVILTRVVELLHSRRNEIWLLQQGAVEYGRKHYPFIVALHALFLISLIVEHYTVQNEAFNAVLLLLYFILLAFKVWVIGSLGKFWNTRIYRVTGFPLVKKGPYKYFKHPNYVIVIAEIAIIPLVFNLYFTAIVFTILNSIMLFVRIKEENKALRI
jgi:methyltransferase